MEIFFFFENIFFLTWEFSDSFLFFFLKKNSPIFVIDFWLKKKKKKNRKKNSKIFQVKRKIFQKKRHFSFSLKHDLTFCLIRFLLHARYCSENHYIQMFSFHVIVWSQCNTIQVPGELRLHFSDM